MMVSQVEKKSLNWLMYIETPGFFYYWHTHMDADSLEEPNPTLYIGKLKK